jgi:uncharacterized protein (DUF433 family)
MSRISNVVAAFTEEQTERLTGVSRRQLQHWDRTAFFVPSMAAGNRRLAYSRLYSFRDIVSLRVINELRNKAGVSLPHLREVKEKLVHLGDDIWSKTTLYVLNRRVVFHNPDDGVLEEVLSRQGVMQIPLQIITGTVEDDVAALRRRDPASVGKVERHRSIAHNQPVVAGTRIPVSTVKAFAAAGYSTDAIRREYPTLTEADISAAIAYGTAA